MSNPSPDLPVRRIVLTGFMGSGKTTVGPLVATRLGWQFVDVDDVIEAEAGCHHCRALRPPRRGRLSRPRARHNRPSGRRRRTGARSRRRRHRTAGNPQICCSPRPARCWFILKSSWPRRWPAAGAPNMRAPSLPIRPTSPAATAPPSALPHRPRLHPGGPTDSGAGCDWRLWPHGLLGLLPCSRRFLLLSSKQAHRYDLLSGHFHDFRFPGRQSRTRSPLPERSAVSRMRGMRRVPAPPRR